jgi:hypothetical protein
MVNNLLCTTSVNELLRTKLIQYKKNKIQVMLILLIGNTQIKFYIIIL